MIKINGYDIEVKQFPNGESLIDGTEILELSGFKTADIEFIYEDDKDLIHLMFIKKFLDKNNIVADLEMAYVPYSRLDRAEGKAVFTLKYVAEFINSLNFHWVAILDAHSDVTPALINKSDVVGDVSNVFEGARKLDLIEFDKEKDFICFPDGGATKKYSKKFKGYNTLSANKLRDFDTGQILSLELNGNPRLWGQTVVICDDLCSKGGTFLWTAAKLKEIGAGKIYLIITHCENTIFDGKVLDEDSLIEKVYTTTSIIQDNHGFENLVIM